VWGVWEVWGERKKLNNCISTNAALPPHPPTLPTPPTPCPNEVSAFLSAIRTLIQTAEHWTIPELLGGVKNYDYLPPGWENVEVIATVAIATKRTSLQFHLSPVATGDCHILMGTRGFWCRCAMESECFYVFSGEHLAVFGGVGGEKA
jgi:hypothetical protein